LGTSRDINEKITRADVHRIHNIRRQLSSINEHPDNNNNDRKKGQVFNGRNSNNSTSSLSAPCTPSSGHRFLIRRQSLVDEKPLQDCENMTDEYKAHEHRSSSIHKLFSRRHSRL
jgi:hypothetical protein